MEAAGRQCFEDALALWCLFRDESPEGRLPSLTPPGAAEAAAEAPTPRGNAGTDRRPTFHVVGRRAGYGHSISSDGLKRQCATSIAALVGWNGVRKREARLQLRAQVRRPGTVDVVDAAVLRLRCAGSPHSLLYTYKHRHLY